MAGGTNFNLDGKGKDKKLILQYLSPKLWKFLFKSIKKHHQTGQKTENTHKTTRHKPPAFNQL